MMAKLRDHGPSAHSGPSELAGLIERCAAREKPHYGIPKDVAKDADALMLEILREIDETMLPRRLTIQCEPAGSVTLLLSNRRLLAVETQEPTQQAPARSPMEAAHNFASSLRTVLDQARSVVFHRPKHVSSQDFTDLSVSASLLGHALGIHDFDTPGKSDPNTPTTIASYALASLEATQGLEFSNALGAEHDIDQLKAFWCSYITSKSRIQRNAHIQSASKTCCVIPIDATRGVAVTTKDKETWQLALIPRDRFQDLADAWA